jgi:Ca2+-binding RTX toxin-like protein
MSNSIANVSPGRLMDMVERGQTATPDKSFDPRYVTDPDDPLHRVFKIFRYDIIDKNDHVVDTVDVWFPSSIAQAGGQPITERSLPPSLQNDDPNGPPPDPDQIVQVEVVDANGNTVESISGSLGGIDDFTAGLAGTQSSDQRYAYWVSLFDGDIAVNAGKGDDDLEVGAVGIATVNAGKGDDLLRVWHQKDVIFNGGKGVDTINFDVSLGSTPAAPTGAVVNLKAGTGTNPFGGTLSFTAVENAFGVSDKANTLTGSDKANQLGAGHQADTIKGEGGDDYIIIQENFGVGPRALSVDGGTGSDTLSAYLGYVEDFTGSGQTLRHGNVLDLLDPSHNTGTFEGGSFSGFETYRASGFDQWLAFDFRGSDSGETAIGISGRDNLQGRGGNDTLRGSFGADTIGGGDGRDVADYSDTYLKIVAKINGASTEIKVNGVAEDTLISIEGAKGGNANDKLTGDAGANEFDGSLGKDTLTGKGGKDHFVFSTALSAANVDTIKDFTHGKDKIDLDDAIFAALGPTISSGEFIKVSSGHAAKQSDDRLIYNTTDGGLWLDKDGTGNKAAVQFAVLTGSPDDLTFKDFHIV